jgi:hypothetical protein
MEQTNMSKLPDKISISWHFTDVQEIDNTLTNHEARQVLQMMKDGYDANFGLTWDDVADWITYFKEITK